MSNILAIDTSTDACSVALFSDGQYRDIHEIVPRQHNRRIFSMLRELLPDGDLRAQGIDAIAYANGPGSFTGLRIAASVVQGLAYASSLPAIPVSTLACQAQTALRIGAVAAGELVLSMLDARMGEVYWALYGFHHELAELHRGPAVCAPGDVPFDEAIIGLKGVGSGFHHVEQLPEILVSAVSAMDAELLPTARDLIPLALRELQSNNIQQPWEVMPVYVRDEISWRKISPQGKSE